LFSNSHDLHHIPVEIESLATFSLTPTYCRYGAVHKRRPQFVVVKCGRFADKVGGVFKCRRPHFLVQKTLDFSELMVCLHGQRVSQCGHFAD